MKSSNTPQIIAVSGAIIFGMLAQSLPAVAAPQASDYFNRVSQSTASLRASVNSNNVQVRTPQDWFAKFDQAEARLAPTAADRVILSRPFNQELERVKQWIGTADKVARNYRTLARNVRAIPVPQGSSGIKEYRDLMADWCNDAASVYEDMVRPRRPAKTMEELESTLNEIKSRAQSVGESHTNLVSMDNTLRQTYSIPAADDALDKYVKGK